MAIEGQNHIAARVGRKGCHLALPELCQDLGNVLVIADRNLDVVNHGQKTSIGI